MSGWQVGDLAVKRRGECSEIPRGTVLRVTGLNDSVFGLGLLFDEYPYEGGYFAYNFDKIKPDTEGANEDDAAWLKDLLAKPKVQVQP